ncbi:T9SS type A sorting domain-containing protein [candidate division KSB1 bacterium]|nr:T9SS type A sorting domain-containing protein [candidate division KSB1 bacterium]
MSRQKMMFNPDQKIKKLLITLILAILFIAHSPNYAQSPDFSWITTAGGTERDALWDLAIDQNGNCYVVGSFNGTASFNGTNLISQGYNDIFVAKYNASGNLIWAHKFGAGDYDEAKCVAVDADSNILVAGSFGGTVDFGANILSGASDIFLLKMNPEGNVLWAKKAGGPGIESVEDIVLDETDNIYLTGGFATRAQFGSIVLTTADDQNAFVAKYNTAGDVQWANGYGGGKWLSGYGITIDPAGFLRVTGRFTEQITFNGTTLVSAGSWDGFIVKQKQDGTILWAKGFGGLDNETMHGIASDNEGNTVVTGFFGGYGNPVSFDGYILNPVGSNTDILVAKYDSSGNVIWAEAAGGSFSDTGFEVTMDGIGNSYVTGRFKDSTQFADTTLVSAGEMDVFIAKYDSDGNIDWIKQGGGTEIDEGFAIALDGLEDVLAGGFFGGSADFDLFNVNSAGNKDIFITKLIQPLSGIQSRRRIEPMSSLLYQNYPNPFNPATTIQYNLPEVSDVRLTVFNIKGQLVEQLVNATQNAGIYTVQWGGIRESGESYPSGLYFYELRTESYREIMKMFLVK